jgi:hypothetical protein
MRNQIENTGQVSRIKLGILAKYTEANWQYWQSCRIKLEILAKCTEETNWEYWLSAQKQIGSTG